MSFQETSNSIQYSHLDFPDDSNEQKYEFMMSGFDMFDQWVHFVRKYSSFSSIARSDISVILVQNRHHGVSKSAKKLLPLGIELTTPTPL